MAKALFGHVGVGNDVRLVAEVTDFVREYATSRSSSIVHLP